MDPTSLPMASSHMYPGCLWNSHLAEEPRTHPTGKRSNSEIKSSTEIAKVKNKNQKSRSLSFR